jgi:hypothetical protein
VRCCGTVKERTHSLYELSTSLYWLDWARVCVFVACSPHVHVCRGVHGCFAGPGCARGLARDLPNRQLVCWWDICPSPCREEIGGLASSSRHLPEVCYLHRPDVLTHVLAGQSNRVSPYSALLACWDHQQHPHLQRLPDTLSCPAAASAVAVCACRCCLQKQPSTQWSACAPVPTCTHTAFYRHGSVCACARVLPAAGELPLGQHGSLPAPLAGLALSAVSGVGLEWCCLLPCIVHP